MKDPYPEYIDIDIDRVGLLKYLRVTWFLSWTLGLGCFGLIFGLLASIERIEKNGFEGFSGLLMILITSALAVFAIGASLGFILYLTLGHFRAKRTAEELQLKVEGPFLRVIQPKLIGSVDRKIHFRSIIDFTTISNRWMAKYGIKTLQMNTASGGPNCFIRIDGIKDCDRVRDMLAEIDCLRENESHE